jgi:hypothetical protein
MKASNSALALPLVRLWCKAEQKQQHHSDQAGTFAPSLRTGRLPKISLTTTVFTNWSR